METVTVRLTSAWPTDRGLRRPIEGPIPFPADEAERIVETGCGEIVEDGEAEPAAKPKIKGKAAPPPPADPE